MATTPATRPAPAFWPALWIALKELDFITTFFSWVFMLLSRLAEPCMTLSSLYVIVQTGVPSLHNDAIYSTAIACMLGAPEIILPGAFVLAGKERARNKTASWILYVCASLFVLLTLATLADLFIWKLQGQALSALMFARCAVSVGYSIIFRVIIHTTENATRHTTANTTNNATTNTTANTTNNTTVNTTTGATTCGQKPANLPAKNPPTNTTNNTTQNTPKTRQKSRQGVTTKGKIARVSSTASRRVSERHSACS